MCALSLSEIIKKYLERQTLGQQVVCFIGPVNQRIIFWIDGFLLDRIAVGISNRGTNLNHYLCILVIQNEQRTMHMGSLISGLGTSIWC